MAVDFETEAGPTLGPIRERRRNFVVVVDDSAESRRAIRFASGRAAHVTGGAIILFRCLPPIDFQHWMAVAEKMREEAFAEAQAGMEDVAARIYAYSGVRPEIVIREGQPKEELARFMKERADLFALILASSATGEPGPLVDYFSGPMVSGLPCPVVIVPGTLDPETIDEMV